MIFKVLTSDTKNEGWKVLTIQEGIENGRTFSNVSINKANKTTQAVQWPTFDTIDVGQTLEGEYKEYEGGKKYLFPPTPKKQAGNSAFKGKQIEEAQERTRGHVAEAQENKNHAISIAAAQRDAVLMVTTFDKSEPFLTDAELRAKIIEWREWFLKEHQNRLNQPF